MTLEHAAQDADERAARQLTRRQELESRFAQIAEGKPWYEGEHDIFPHQWQGACFGAVAKRWFLGDEMGLGKTRTSIGWLDLVGAKKVILVAEANVAAQFAGEVMELAPHRTIITLAGLSKKVRMERLARAARLSEAVLVINYEMFRRDVDSLAKVLAWQADTIIVDEAHNMKSVKTSNFKIVQRLMFTDNTCEQCGGLILGLSKPCKSCGHVQTIAGMTRTEQKATLKRYLSNKSVQNSLLMSGTPLLNSPVDLYSIFHLTDPVKFPTLDVFKKRFLKPSHAEGSRKMVFKRDGLEQLQPYIKNFFLARSKTDVGEVQEDGSIVLPGGIVIPAQHERIIRVDLDEERYPLQLRTVKQVSEQARIALASGLTHNIMEIITVILRKRQANVWPGGIEIRDKESQRVIFSVGSEVQESAKMDAALEQIQAYHAEGRRQVVFSQFSTALAEFEKRINAAGIRAVRFDGSTPRALRERIKTNFYRAKNETPEWDVVLVHYRTGGAGLNLTSATVTHILDEEWNEGKKQQGYGRTNRIGQTEENDVLVYRIPNSVDTYMAGLIAMKKKMAGDLRRTMSNQEMFERAGEAILKGEML